MKNKTINLSNHHSRLLVTSFATVILTSLALGNQTAQADTATDRPAAPKITSPVKQAPALSTRQVPLTTPTNQQAQSQSVQPNTSKAGKSEPLTTNQHDTTTKAASAPASESLPITPSTTPQPATPRLTSTQALKTHTITVNDSAPTTIIAGHAPAPTTTHPVTTTNAVNEIDTWMPNTRLQAEVLKALQSLKNPGKSWNSVADITKDDMQLLTAYSGSDTYIDGKSDYSLQGLEYATNLTSIRLNKELDNPSGAYYGDVHDISPLANLTKLTTVNIRNNSVSDISPLAHLTNMTTLWANFNHIADFSSLKNLPNLKDLEYGNQVIVRTTPIKVDRQKLTATLDSDCYLEDDTVAPLATAKSIGMPVKVNLNTGQFWYSFFWNGAADPDKDVTVNQNGGLDFINLQAQPTQWWAGDANGQYNGINIVPVKDFYYLVGAYRVGSVYFAVAQPYEFVDAQPVTVKFTDKAGHALAPEQTITGNIGDAYTTKPITIDGYVFDRVQDNNATGTISDSAQTVVYLYDQLAQPVTVHYQDASGQSLAPDQQLTGTVGATYAAEQLTIPNYTFSHVLGNASGLFSTTAQTVTFVYDRTLGQAVTVKYVDDQGQILRADELHQGPLGTAYTITPATIDGYTLHHVTGNLTGTFGPDAQTIILTYQKNTLPATTGTVTVHYLTTDGHELSASQVLSGEVGTTYQTSARSFSGYRLIAEPTNANGLFAADNQDVRYIYEPVTETGDGDGNDQNTDGDGDHGNPEEPTTPIKPAPTQPNETGSNSDSSTQSNDHPTTETGQSAPIAAAQLPQTGDHSNGWAAILGGLLALLAGLGVTRKRD